MTPDILFDREYSRTKRSRLVAEDPRLLIILFGVLIVFTFVVPTTGGLAVLLAYVFALHILSGAPIGSLVRTARNIAFFILLVIGINAYLVEGTSLPPPLDFFSIEGFVAGVYYSLRVLVLYFAVTVFLSLTTQEALARGLSSLLTPVSKKLARRVALYGFLALGFLPLFVDELERIRVAQRFRGGGLKGGLIQKIVGTRLLLVPLLLSAIHRSGQLAAAVEVRGIKRSIGRLLTAPNPTAKDFVFSGVTFVVLIAAVLVP